MKKCGGKMNILFITYGGADYLSDCLLHGLCSLKDVDVYTSKNLWFMYMGNDKKRIKRIYGKGFSYSNRIPICEKHMHTDKEITYNIQNHFYDYIIYGTATFCLDYFKLAEKFYEKKQILFLDGQDSDFSLFYYYKAQNKIKGFNPISKIQERSYFKELAQRGIVFKRELRKKDAKYAFPISFAIPKENIVSFLPEKEKKTATIIPGDLSTYVFSDEKEYFEDYQKSIYGVTCRKAGWDCLRHYEILANACIPYFPALEKCPSTIMSTMPKKILLETNKLFHEPEHVIEREYVGYAKALLEYTRNHLTTEKLAEYVLSKAGGGL